MYVRRPLAETGLLFSPLLLNMSGQKCQNENSLRKFSERFQDSRRRHHDQLRKALACSTTEPTSTSLESTIRHTERKEGPSRIPQMDPKSTTSEIPHSRRRTSSTDRRRRSSQHGQTSFRKKRQLQDCTTEMTEEVDDTSTDLRNLRECAKKLLLMTRRKPKEQQNQIHLSQEARENVSLNQAKRKKGL